MVASVTGIQSLLNFLLNRIRICYCRSQIFVLGPSFKDSIRQPSSKNSKQPTAQVGNTKRLLKSVGKGEGRGGSVSQRDVYCSDEVGTDTFKQTTRLITYSKQTNGLTYYEATLVQGHKIEANCLYTAYSGVGKLRIIT
jgi:hypothetical protein